MNDFFELIGSLSILAGAVLTLAASIGLLRFPDLLTRVHAVTKPQTLGMLLILIGMGFLIDDKSATSLLIVIAILQLVTAPIGAHMITRTVVRSNPGRKDLLFTDEYHGN